MFKTAKEIKKQLGSIDAEVFITTGVLYEVDYQVKTVEHGELPDGNPAIFITLSNDHYPNPKPIEGELK